MKFISAQPANLYYAWQVEVYLNNFIKNGVLPSQIHVLFGLDGYLPKEILLLIEKYKEVKFFLYNDLRDDKRYIPSIYFNLVKQHYKAHPDLEKDTILFHDSDTLLLKPLDIQTFHNKNCWLFSNTNSYINYDYIMQKGEDVYQRMLDIVGLDKRIPKICNNNSGGAQHVIKKATYEYWDKVERDSVALYKMFCETEHLYQKKNEWDYPIQKWTAGMWSLLWNAWWFGYEVQVSDDLNFCWATDKIDAINNNQFLHNAGVTEDRADLFFKGKYTNTLPYRKELNIAKEYCSYYYYEQIKETEKVSPLTYLSKF